MHRINNKEAFEKARELKILKSAKIDGDEYPGVTKKFRDVVGKHLTKISLDKINQLGLVEIKTLIPLVIASVKEYLGKGLAENFEKLDRELFLSLIGLIAQLLRERIRIVIKEGEPIYLFVDAMGDNVLDGDSVVDEVLSYVYLDDGFHKLNKYERGIVRKWYEILFLLGCAIEKKDRRPYQGEFYETDKYPKHCLGCDKFFLKDPLSDDNILQILKDGCIGSCWVKEEKVNCYFYCDQFTLSAYAIKLARTNSRAPYFNKGFELVKRRYFEVIKKYSIEGPTALKKFSMINILNEEPTKEAEKYFSKRYWRLKQEKNLSSDKDDEFDALEFVNRLYQKSKRKRNEEKGISWKWIKEEKKWIPAHKKEKELFKMLHELTVLEGIKDYRKGFKPKFPTKRFIDRCEECFCCTYFNIKDNLSVETILNCIIHHNFFGTCYLKGERVEAHEICPDCLVSPFAVDRSDGMYMMADSDVKDWFEKVRDRFDEINDKYLTNWDGPLLEEYPELAAEYITNAANIFKAEGNVIYLLECCEHLLKLNPKDQAALELNCWGLTQRGMLHYSKGDTFSAVEDLSRALEINSTYSPALIYFGHCYLALNDQQRAIEYYKLARESAPVEEKALAWSVLGLAYNHFGDYENAVICCKKATELDPSESTFWKNLGEVYLSMGDNDNLLICQKKASETLTVRQKYHLFNNLTSLSVAPDGDFTKQPTSISGQNLEINQKALNTAFLEEIQKDIQEIIADAKPNESKELADLPKRCNFCLYFFIKEPLSDANLIGYVALGRFFGICLSNKSMVDLQDTCDNFTPSKLAAKLWNQKCSESGHPEQILKVRKRFEEVLEREQEKSKPGKLDEIKEKRNIWITKSLDAYEQSNFKEALEFLNKGMEIDPTVAKGWLSHAQILEKLNKPAAALISYIKSLAFNPDDAEAIEGKNRLLKQFSPSKLERELKEVEEELSVSDFQEIDLSYLDDGDD